MPLPMAIACVAEPFFADPLPDKYGDPHGKADNHNRQRLHNLASRGNGGYARRSAELADDKQIDRTIHGLQNSASSTGSAKRISGEKNFPLCEIAGLRHC